MARTLSSFDFSQPSVLTSAEKAQYHWDDWFNGDIWELTQGEDFHGHPLMMERIVRTRATSRHAKIQLRHVGVNGDNFGKLVVQRIDIVGPTEAKKQARREKRTAAKTNGAKSKRPVRKTVAAPA